MQREFIVRGRLSDSHHIELTDPAPKIAGEFEILIRLPDTDAPEVKMDVFALHRDAKARDATTNEDIERQIQEERAVLEQNDELSILTPVR